MRWSHSIPGWGAGPRLLGDKVLIGPVGGFLWGFAISSGELIDQIAYEGIAGLLAADPLRLIVRREGFLTAIQWDGSVIWKRETLPSHIRLSGQRLLLTERFDRQLVCLDASSGAERWCFEAPPEGKGDDALRSQIIPAGFPSVTVVGDRVIVLTMGFRIFVLLLETGEVLSRAKPPFAGWYLVTDTSIFFKQAFGLSEFDHRELKEVDRIEYRADVEPLYQGRQVSVNAFCLSEESVIWTTGHGALMGVSRKPGPDGRRVTWSHEIPGAIMPFAEPPTLHGNYLYFTKKGTNPELLCFRSRDLPA